MTKTAEFIQGAILRPMTVDGIGASDIVRAGRTDELALALRLVIAATDLAQRAGADIEEIIKIREMARKLI